MKRILILLPNLPYPLDSGGNQGTYHMINAIKDDYELFLWYLSDFAVDSRLESEFMDSIGGKCRVFHTVKRKGINIATMRGIHYKIDSFLLKNNLEFRHNHMIWGKETSSRFDNYILEDIKTIITDNDIDIVQVEYMELIDYVYALPSSVKKVFIHHELGFVRKKTLLNNLNDKCIYDDFQYKRALSREISALNNYELVVAMTNIDKDKLVEEGVNARIEVSSSYIPLTNKTYPDFGYSSDRLTFIASGVHYPNVEGLKWFIEKVHPLLVANIDYKLEVIGSRWRLNSLGGVPRNITFSGFIECLTDVVPGSVMIVPILSGSGMRMKILESGNNSVPFVSTTVGAEGLFFQDSRDCYIADTPEMFAKRIENLLLDKKMQKDFVMNSRSVYEKNYSKDILSKRRIDVLNVL